MKFGLFAPQIFDVASTVAAAQRAETVGFDSFWLADHLFTPGAPQAPMLESWVALTAVAVQTSKLRLGQLVICGPLRHPAVVAKMAATLDQVSGGRLLLGLGWGSVDEEFAMYGVPVGSRRQRAEELSETIEILRLMFAGEPFDYEGHHFALKGAIGRPRPVQEHIPILIGGGGKQLTMPLVARYADWWNCVAAAREHLDELAALRGHARLSVQYPVALLHPGDDREDVMAKVKRRLPRGGWGEIVIGAAAELREFFAAEAERGVELAILRFYDVANERTLDVFGADVIRRSASSPARS
jgi:alkanesulfonate monooxygenase SsuD/methylene tetrahydromethanopterin reductase-like flavin-dependent oxidoreductase (luciferase family)